MESTPPPSLEPPSAPSGGIAPPDSPLALDTDDTRGRHIKDLAAKPLTLSLGSVLVITAFVAATSAAGAAIGAGAALAAALLIALVLWVLASNAAAEDFFSSYAAARGLDRVSGRTSLPPSTPLLRKGDERYAEQVMNGTLPGGAAGALALYTYEVETRDSEGNKDTSYHRFTVVMHDLPAVASRVSDLYCQRRSGFRFMDGAEDAFRRMKRLELESDAFDRRYEVFHGAEDDPVWLKRLFSPSFIVWMAEQPPDNFAFELSAGSLCVNASGHRDSAADLDRICEAAGVVATRLDREAAE